MDIKKDIRSKLSKRLNERIKWDAKNAPNTYELNNFLNKAGYRLVSIDATSDTAVPEIIIKPSKSNREHLYPEIWQNINEGVFYINVKEYGMLNSIDMEDIIVGYNNALGVIKHLNSLNLDTIKEENK